jgi:hypothetical protein
MKISISNSKGKSAKNKNEGATVSPQLQLTIFVIVLTLIFFPLFFYLYKMPYSATPLYYNFASRVLEGSLPYRDFSVEYPPFALLFFILPRFFTSYYWTYAVYYRIEVFIFILVGLLVIYKIAQRMGKAPWKMLLFYTLAILAIGPIIAEQYDIFPAVMTLLALYCFWLGKHKTSWILIALGALTKIYPIFIGPIFLIYYIRNQQYRRIWSAIVALGVTILAVVLPFLIISFDSLWFLISYHGQRGIQLESLYSSFLLVADKLGFTAVGISLDFGSWNLASPLADALAKVSIYIMGFFLLLAYWFIYNQMKAGKSQFIRIGAFALLITAVTLVFDKVLSPQYLIWLIPFIPLVFGPFSITILVIFMAIGFLTYIIFPLNYLALITVRTDQVVILLLRNILLILLAAMAVVSLRRMKPSD